MKKPIAYIGVSVLFSLVFATAFHTAAVWAVVVCFVFSVVCFVLDRRSYLDLRVPALCAVSMCVAMLAYIGVVKYYVEPIAEKFSGETVEFSGTIISKPFTENGNTHFTVKTDTVNGEKKHINIYVSTSYTTTAHTYDSINGKATLNSIFDYGYGYESYYAARHIFLSAYINPYYDSYYSVSENESRPFTAVFSDIRECIASQLKKYLPYDEASVCTAILTGEKVHMRDEVYAAFKNLGISHILVVSGLHLSIVAAVLIYITSLLPKKKYIQIAESVIQILGITVFAAVTGFGFSVTRAWIMSVVRIAAEYYDRIRYNDNIRHEMRKSGLDFLGAAAVVLCADPLSAGDIGMLWSFSCTLSIMLFTNGTDDLMKRLFRIESGFGKLLSAASSTSIAAFVGSLPFVIFAVGSFSPYTVILNLLTVPITGFLIIFGGLGAVVSAVHCETVAGLLMKSACVLARYLIWITGEFSELPYSSVGTAHNYLYVWFFVMLAVFIGCIFVRMIKLSEIDRQYLEDEDKDLLRKIRNDNLRGIYINIMLVSVVLLLLGCCADFIMHDGEIKVSVLDIGSGMTVTVNKGDSVVLLDSYGEKYQYNTIKDELSNYNEIACLIDITPYKPAYDYNRRIIHDFDIDKILVYGEDMYNEKYGYQRYLGKDVSEMTDDYTLTFFGGVVLDISNESKNSWQYLTVYGTSILICPQNSDFSALPQYFSDPDIVVMNNIPEEFGLSCNVLIVVSDYGEDCRNTISVLKEQGYMVNATNGAGRVDFVFSKNGKLRMEREYTGGVTRYADN